MFYSTTLFQRNGALSRVWLSANIERKISKQQVLQADVHDSVQTIITPEVPLALRLSGQLLLGVVRIYSRKARYLLDDCNEALMKIKMVSRPVLCYLRRIGANLFPLGLPVIGKQ